MDEARRLRERARHNSIWHASIAEKWQPWPFSFGPFGDANHYHWHSYAASQYGKAADDLRICLEHHTAPPNFRSYERMNDAVARVMQTANYKDYSFSYERQCPTL